jgi:hypothetical protein
LPQIISFAQNGSSESSTRNVIVPPVKVRKSTGWELPTKARALSPTTVVQLAGLEVEKEAFNTKDSIVEFEEYYVESPKDLRVEICEGRFGTFIEYSRKGRKFAVQTNFNLVVGGVSTAGVSPIIFVDGDGDGKFEERYRTTSLPELPQWVKDLN